MPFQVSREDTGFPGDIKPLTHLGRNFAPTYSFLSKYRLIMAKTYYNHMVKSTYLLRPRSSIYLDPSPQLIVDQQ